MTIRILLVEDRPVDAALIERELRRSGLDFELRRVETDDAFRQELARFSPDVILADYHLPQFDGLSALSIVRGTGSELPFIFVSGSIGEEAAVETLRLGASDYVLKDRLARLPAAIERALELAKLSAAAAGMQRQLEQAGRVSSLGRVAATMAHEFNNVLMGIQPFADLLARVYRDPQAQQIASQLQSSVIRGKAITQEILRFATDAELELRTIDVASWIDSVAAELRQLLDGRTLRTDLPATPLHVLGDLSALQQVMTNLILNARDAMGEGGTVTISVRSADRDALLSIGAVPMEGDSVVVSVSDTGAGIPPAVLERIFEPMFTTKRKGNGLGLALTNAVITRHRGQLRVESAVGSGTTFHIVLPRTRAAVEPIPDAVVRRRAINRLLLVDDDENVGIAVSAALHFEGVETEVVTTGAEVVDAVERFSPDAVLLDVGLPDESGFAVYDRIRSRWRDLPVVFASGHLVDTPRVEDPRSRTASVTKPYRLDELLDILTKLVA